MITKFDVIESILNDIINLSKNTVEHDIFDKITFDRMFNKCNELKRVYNTYNAGFEKDELYYPFTKELQQDIFYSFFKYNPKFLDDEKIQPEYRVHKKIIEKAQLNENWRKMRNITKLDEVNSTIATAFFSDELLKEMTKRDKKCKEQIKKLNEQRQKLIELMNNFANSTNDDERKKLTEKIKKLREDMEREADDVSNGISQITVSQAIKNATKKMTEFYEITNTLMWGSETSELQKVSPEERIVLANYLITREKLFKLVRELGKLKNVFIETKRKRITYGTSEVHSVDIGKDIGKILPCEIMKMRHPILKRDFYRRFVEGNLLQYSLKDKEKMGKGDIIVALDISGSMQQNLYGNISREIYAKALALAILDMAIRENRKYHLIIFESEVKFVYSFDKNKKPSIRDIIDIASMISEGGTNFEKPLYKALEYTNEHSDIVFITDGECRVGGDFLSKLNTHKKTTDFRIVGLHVGKTSIYLKEFCDEIIDFKDFIDTSKDLFSSLIKEA